MRLINSRLEIDKFKNELTLNTLYDEKVEGIVVGARARWHEYGDKSSKYFFKARIEARKTRLACCPVHKI